MVMVLRVQHRKSGEGMYMPFPDSEDGFDSFWKMATNQNGISNYDRTIHPPPYADKGFPKPFYMRDSLFCGFKDAKQLLNWIHVPSWRYGLDELDQKLHIFQVPEEYYLEGNNQILFERKESEIIAKAPLTVFDTNSNLRFLDNEELFYELKEMGYNCKPRFKQYVNQKEIK